MLNLLRANRRFSIFWGGSTISMMGDRIQEVALAWLVLSKTGSPGQLAVVLGAMSIPRAVLMVIGGALTDRFSPRLPMFWSNVVRLVLAALIAFLASGDLVVWTLYPVTFAYGVADAFYYPATNSALTLVVTDDNELPPANALFGISEQTSLLVGPAVGGVIVAAFGASPAIVINAASFLLAALAALEVPSIAQGRTGGGTSIWQEIIEGVSYARRSKEVQAMLILVTGASLTYGGVFTVGLPSLARHRFPQGAVALGFMFAAWGAGQLVGSIGAGFTGLPKRLGAFFIAMSGFEAVSILAIGFAPFYGVASGILFVLGIGVAYSTDIALPTWLQQRADRQLLGRVTSLVEAVRQSCAQISLVWMGAVASLSVTGAFAAGSVLMALTALTLAAIPTIRHLSW